MPDKSIIEAIINAVLQVVIPDKIILFGSQATGKAQSDSDYDIIVIKSGIDDEISLAKQIYRKLVDVDASVDVIVKTPKSIDKSKNLSGSIIKPAIKEGIVIYG